MSFICALHEYGHYIHAYIACLHPQRYIDKCSTCSHYIYQWIRAYIQTSSIFTYIYIYTLIPCIYTLHANVDCLHYIYAQAIVSKWMHISLAMYISYMHIYIYIHIYIHTYIHIYIYKHALCVYIPYMHIITHTCIYSM